MSTDFRTGICSGFNDLRDHYPLPARPPARRIPVPPRPVPDHPDGAEVQAVLVRQAAQLHHKGFAASYERFAGHGAVRQRHMLRWVPSIVWPTEYEGSSREYVMEVSLPEFGRASCVFAGCGFDTIDCVRHAGRSLRISLEDWCVTFLDASRRKHDAFFTAARSAA